MPKLPTVLFGDVQAVCICSELVPIKWLSLGRQNEKLRSLLTSVKKLSWTFVGNVKLLYAEGVFIFKNEDKDAYFLLLFLNPKIEHFSLASNRTGKIDPSRGVLLVFDVYTFEPIIS